MQVDILDSTMAAWMDYFLAVLTVYKRAESRDLMLEAKTVGQKE